MNTQIFTLSYFLFLFNFSPAQKSVYSKENYYKDCNPKHNEDGECQWVTDKRTDNYSPRSISNVWIKLANKKVITPETEFNLQSGIKFLVPGPEGTVLFYKRNPVDVNDIAGVLKDVTMVKPLIRFHDNINIVWNQFILNGDTLWMDVDYGETVSMDQYDPDYKVQKNILFDRPMDRFNQYFLLLEDEGRSLAKIIILEKTKNDLMKNE